MSEIALVTDSKKQALEKTIQATIDTVLLTIPEVKDRLTVACVYSYLQLPDAAFGWEGKTGNPVSMASKCLVIATCLKFGLVPGMGHLYFLGNKPYLTADGKKFMAANNPTFKYRGKRSYRAFTDDERAMFCIEPDDMCLVLEQSVLVKGQEIEAVGYGIIGADELGSRKPGLDTKKNRCKTLRTRAINDLLGENLPLDGISQADDPGEVALDEKPQPEKAIALQVGSSEDDETRRIAIEILKSKMKEAQARGLETPEIASFDDLYTDQIERLSEFIDGLIKADEPIEMEDPIESMEPVEPVEAIEKPHKEAASQNLATIIDSLLSRDNKPEVKEILEKLKEKNLPETLRHEIIRYTREANAGKLKNLAGLLDQY